MRNLAHELGQRITEKHERNCQVIALTGAGFVGFTLVPAWWMMVLLGGTAGFGAEAIDAAFNTYVAAHFVEGLMQWLHASYGIGVSLGKKARLIVAEGFQHGEKFFCGQYSDLCIFIIYFIAGDNIIYTILLGTKILNGIFKIVEFRIKC